MIIQKLGKEIDKYADFTLDENVITFAGQLEIDLEAEEKDDEANIPVCFHGTEYHRNLHEGCAYVAQILIPPRRYDIDYEDVKNKETDEFESKEIKIPVPFDIENVVLRLWPIQIAVNSEGDQEIDN